MGIEISSISVGKTTPQSSSRDKILNEKNASIFMSENTEKTLENEESSDKKKWIGIGIGIAAVVISGFLLYKLKGLRDMIKEGFELAKEAKDVPMEALKTDGKSSGLVSELLESSVPKEDVVRNIIGDQELRDRSIAFLEKRVVAEDPKVVERLFSSSSSGATAKDIQQAIEMSGTGPTKLAQIISNDAEMMSKIDEKMPILGEALRKTKAECGFSRTFDEASAYLEECFPGKGYQLKKELGAGSIGATYLAQDASGNNVVVKMIKKGVSVESLMQEEELMLKTLQDTCSPEEFAKKEVMVRDLYRNWSEELNLTQCLEYNRTFAQGAKRYSVAKVLEVSENGKSLVMNMAEGIQMNNLMDILKAYKADPANFSTKYADLIAKNPWLADPEKVIRELPETLTKSFSEQFLFLRDGGTTLMHGDPHTGNFFIRADEKGRLIPEFIDTDNCVLRTSTQVKADVSMFTNYLVGNSNKVAEYFVNLTDCAPEDKQKYIEIISKDLKEVIFDKKCNITDYSTMLDNVNVILKNHGLNMSLDNSTALKAQFQFMKVIGETHQLAGDSCSINFLTLIKDIPRATFDMVKTRVNPYSCVKDAMFYTFRNPSLTVANAGQFFV